MSSLAVKVVMKTQVLCINHLTSLYTVHTQYLWNKSEQLSVKSAVTSFPF